MEVSDRLMAAVLEILSMMTQSGAEIYRVEESATRMFLPYNVKSVDVFATTSNIIVSVEDADGTIKTHTHRIFGINPDIEKVHCLNDLSRRMSKEKMPIAEIEEEIKKISECKAYPLWLSVAMYGLTASAFYLLFGGRSVIDFVLTFVLGLVTGIISHFCQKRGVRSILYKFICSFVFSLATVLCARFGIVKSVDYMIIGSIMTLIPGAGLVDSIRDLFLGDSVSGILRFIEAVLAAFAIACGYVISVVMTGGAL